MKKLMDKRGSISSESAFWLAVGAIGVAGFLSFVITKAMQNDSDIELIKTIRYSGFNEATKARLLEQFIILEGNATNINELTQK